MKIFFWTFLLSPILCSIQEHVQPNLVESPVSVEQNFDKSEEQPIFRVPLPMSVFGQTSIDELESNTDQMENSQEMEQTVCNSVKDPETSEILMENSQMKEQKVCECPEDPIMNPKAFEEYLNFIVKTPEGYPFPPSSSYLESPRLSGNDRNSRFPKASSASSRVQERKSPYEEETCNENFKKSYSVPPWMDVPFNSSQNGDQYGSPSFTLHENCNYVAPDSTFPPLVGTNVRMPFLIDNENKPTPKESEQELKATKKQSPSTQNPRKSLSKRKRSEEKTQPKKQKKLRNRKLDDSKTSIEQDLSEVPSELEIPPRVPVSEPVDAILIDESKSDVANVNGSESEVIDVEKYKMKSSNHLRKKRTVFGRNLDFTPKTTGGDSPLPHQSPSLSPFTENIERRNVTYRHVPELWDENYLNFTSDNPRSLSYKDNYTSRFTLNETPLQIVLFGVAGSFCARSLVEGFEYIVPALSGDVKPLWEDNMRNINSGEENQPLVVPRLKGTNVSHDTVSEKDEQEDSKPIRNFWWVSSR